jgi:hypothetical protein
MKSELHYRITNKWKTFLILFLSIQFCPHLIWGQNFIYMDIGIGNHGKDNVTFADFDLGTGYVLFRNFNCFGGLKLNKYFLDIEVSEDDEFDVTNSVFTLNLYFGASNYFKIINFDENAIFDNFGFFPEFRCFFNPYLPREMNYKQDGVLFRKKGAYKNQMSFGYGGGVFFKTKSGLIAFKVELNSNDPFEVLRNLEYSSKDMPFSKGKQLLISLKLLGF